MGPSSDSRLGKRVCVIGAGMIGLVTTKNLLEQGLEVTTIERNDYVAGLWHVSKAQDRTTALEVTTANNSKQICCYTDYPFPPEAAMLPSSKDIENYIEAYAKKNNLGPHIKLSQAVTRVERDEKKQKWIVYSKDAESPTSAEEGQEFDRLVLATGQLNIPNLPKIKDIDKFAGDAVHSRQFKDPFKYKGKNVVVVGIGATGADNITFLKKGGADKIYLSHRKQFFLLPRVVEGKAFDHTTDRRMLTMLRFVASIAPMGCASLMSKMLTGMRKKFFPKLDDNASFAKNRDTDTMASRQPCFSDELADDLANGRVQSVMGIKEVTGPKSIVLTDGIVLDDIDAMVFCTGYDYDFSALPASVNPTNPDYQPDRYRRMKAAKYCEPHTEFPRLYRGFISERYPDSLAIIGHGLIMGPPFPLYDLASMTLASLWTGAAPRSSLPTPQSMARDIDAHYNFVVSVLQRGRMPHTGFRINSQETYDWMNRTAGTGVTELLGSCSPAAFRLWWQDRKFYNTLMTGINSPAVYRLFDRGYGRKPWDGAKQAILDVNREVQELGEIWKRKQMELQVE